MLTSAWLPEISLEWGRWSNLDRSLSSKPGEEYFTDEALGTRNLWKIKLKWKPADLIFNKYELKLIKEKENMLLKESFLYEKKWKLYYKWCKNLIFFNNNPSFFTMFKLIKLENMLNGYSSNQFSLLIKRFLK